MDYDDDCKTHVLIFNSSKEHESQDFVQNTPDPFHLLINLQTIGKAYSLLIKTLNCVTRFPNSQFQGSQVSLNTYNIICINAAGLIK